MKIFLTGGHSGIGLEIYKALSKNHDIYAPTRQDCDLSSYPDIDVGEYDIMILCAGSDRGGKQPFVSMDDRDWQETLQVNLLSNIHLIKRFLKTHDNKWGKIIVFGSTATDHIWPTMLPYSLSKLALEKFCDAIRQEIDPRLGITMVRPGLVKTNFNYNRHRATKSKQEADAWYDGKPCLLPENFVPIMQQVIDDTSHYIKEITISP